MIQFKRPMLAVPLLLSSVEHTDENILAAMQKLRYPVLATLKKDGIRALRLNGTLLSRTLKPIPNKSIRERSFVLPGGFDMELWNPELEYHEIESIVMSHEHKDSDLIQFHVLDWIQNNANVFGNEYVLRLKRIKEFTEVKYEFDNGQWCVQPIALMNYFLECEQEQGEGICFRLPDSPYKQGRSTLREQYLVKLARYVTAEAEIVGFIEQQENTNRARYNRAGMMDRSSAQDGLVGKNTLGALQVVDLVTKVSFRIGTGVGLDDRLRKEIWNNQFNYLGKIITYKCKPHGQKDKPRSPIFKGFRNPIDL